MAKVTKHILFVVLFGILFTSLLQQNVLHIECGVLNGYYPEAPDSPFTVRKWFNGSFQEEETNYMNDHVGLRPFFIRVNSQIDYTLFHQLDYGGTKMGSNNCLYFYDYIEAYFGRDYAGYEALHEQMRQLKAVQDTLTKLGKTIVTVYAPCKAWFFPEYFPMDARSVMHPNNYKTCLRIGDSLGVAQVDLNRWYLSLKDTSKEVLFARWGIHWTNYGSILGSDTIIRYIERVRHIRMPHPMWSKVVRTREARDPDADIGGTLNLLFPLQTDVYTYPELFYKTDSSTTVPKIIFIGDSYNINLIRTGVMQHISKPWQFWFNFTYLMDSADYNAFEYTKLESRDWVSEVESANCIIVMNTCRQADRLGNGFIQAAYAHYFSRK